MKKLRFIVAQSLAEPSFTLKLEGIALFSRMLLSSAFIRKNILLFCLMCKLHKDEFICSSSSGWNAGSYFYVVMDNIELLRSRLEDASTSEVTFNPVYMIKTSDSWRYSSQEQSTPDWRYNVNPTWQLLAPGNFPAISTTTRYYSLSITVPPLTGGYPLFEFAVYSREGVIVYVNGEEVIRKNLPA